MPNRGRPRAGEEERPLGKSDKESALFKGGEQLRQMPSKGRRTTEKRIVQIWGIGATKEIRRTIKKNTARASPKKKKGRTTRATRGLVGGRVGAAAEDPSQSQLLQKSVPGMGRGTGTPYACRLIVYGRRVKGQKETCERRLDPRPN